MNDVIEKNPIGNRVRDPIEAQVASRIRELRIFRGMSLADLADRLGVTYQQMHKYEKGVNRITCGVLKKIADALDVRPGYFFGERAESLTISGLEHRQMIEFMMVMSGLSPKLRKAVIQLAHNLKEKGDE